MTVRNHFVHGVAAAIVVALVAVVPAGMAVATEILPGIGVTGATVSGPGLPGEVEVAEIDAANFVKGFLATGIFAAQVEEPPDDADIYTVTYTLTAGDASVPTVAKAKFAWDGKSGWVSGGELYAKKDFIRAPPASTLVVSGVLDANGVEFTPDSGSDTPWWIIGVAAVVVLAGVIGVIVWRRRPARVPRSRRAREFRAGAGAAMTESGPPLGVPPVEELLPSRDLRRRRRQRDRRRYWVIGLGAGAALVVLLVAVAWAGGGSGSDGDAAGGATAPSSTTRARRPSSTSTSSTSSGSASSSTSTSSTAPAEPTPEEEETEPPVTAAPSFDEIQAGMTITTARCDSDAGSGALASGGVIANRNADGHLVYYAVSWYADDGFEVASAAEQDWVDGGVSLEWELTSGADEIPTGVRCEATVEVLE